MKKKRIFSVTLALCLCVSAAPTAHAWQGLPQQKFLAAEVSDAEPVAYSGESVCPTYEEAYKSMIALKEKYPEGMTWTNFEPYSSSNVYSWKGGPVKGAKGGVGCAAFAFILSDEAFGSLPARVIDKGGFKFEDVKVGDILRINNNRHSVIVLQKSVGGVTVAEGNYNKSVHWGRAMSEAEVMNADFIVTRYPENFTPADAADANVEIANETAGNLSWSLTKAGTLTISGSGAIPDFSPNDNNLPSWNAHNASIKTIVIEEGVTGIGDYAFKGSEALSVYIPDGVTSIGQEAFCESAFVSVSIPGTVKTIGNNAFRECPNLTSVTVSEGVTTIGENAFRGCTALAYIDFPASITSVGAGAFMSCEKMTRVRFMPGDKPVAMGDNLFTQCWHLSDVTLPQTADRISAGMFESCSALSKIYIPAGVIEIGDKAFTQCYSLQKDDLEKNGIYFGGSENTWNEIGGKAAIITLQPYTVLVKYDVGFEDPFAPIPNDPGDMTVTQTPPSSTATGPSISGTPTSGTSGNSTSGTSTSSKPTTVIQVTIRPDGTRVTVETTMNLDGSKTKKTTEVKTDGSKEETTTVTKTDGSKTETSVITNTDGSRQEQNIETAADGTVTKKTVTDVAADGSATKTEDTKVTNAEGTEVAVNTVTKTDSTGKVTDVTEKSTLAPNSSLTAIVTVIKDGDNNVTEATAAVTNKLSSGSKATLQGSVVSQLTEAAGQKDLAITMTVKNADGKTAYKVKANANDLTAGKELYVYAYNQKTDTYTMVNAKTYKVDSTGSVSVSMTSNKTYELVDSATAKKINKQILATVKVKKSSATVKTGKKTEIALKTTLDKNNVKKITYSTSSKSVATVSKTGKVTAKKAGTATIKAKVTLKNGSTKTVQMKVKVKSSKK